MAKYASMVKYLHSSKNRDVSLTQAMITGNDVDKQYNYVKAASMFIPINSRKEISSYDDYKKLDEDTRGKIFDNLYDNIANTNQNFIKLIETDVTKTVTVDDLIKSAIVVAIE